MQGTVDRIWHNHREDGSEYWVLCIDGERYSTWDEKLVADVREGDQVEFAFFPSGRFKRLTAVRPLGAPAFTTADRLMTKPGLPHQVRMSCLRTAALLVGDCGQAPDQKAALAISIAGRLEEYVLQPSDDHAAREASGDKEEAADDSKGEGHQE